VPGGLLPKGLRVSLKNALRDSLYLCAADVVAVAILASILDQVVNLTGDMLVVG
jgi:hypothetical protein